MKKLHELVAKELHDSALETVATSLEKGKTPKSAINKAVESIRIRTNNLTDKAIKQALLATLTQNDIKNENPYYGDFLSMSIPWHWKLWWRIEKSLPILKNTKALMCTLFLLWGCLHFIFYMNDTYTIRYGSHTYLQNVNSTIYREFVYKIPRDIGTYIIPATVKTYFGSFPGWMMNVFYAGYFVLGAIGINIGLKNNTL